MTRFDVGPVDKHCFMYCGDDRCNCYKAPRYRHLKPPSNESLEQAFEQQDDNAPSTPQAPDTGREALRYYRHGASVFDKETDTQVCRCNSIDLANTVAESLNRARAAVAIAKEPTQPANPFVSATEEKLNVVID